MVMGIFKKFNEPVFMKTGNELENKLKVLKSGLDDVEDKDALRADIILTEMGLQGENRVINALKKSDIGMYVLRDIHIHYGNEKANIDFCIITPAHCYLVECQSMIGNILVSGSRHFKRKYTVDDKEIADTIISPYNKISKYKTVLKNIWFENMNVVDKALFMKYTDYYYKPLIVVPNEAGISFDKQAPVKIKDNIVAVEHLIDYINEDIKNTKRKNLYDQEQMEKVAESILKYHREISANYLDKSHIKVINDITLKNDLVIYRTRKCNEMGITLDLVFSDKELNDIVVARPRTIEDLVKVLDRKKAALFGDEIIAIVNRLYKK